MTWNDVTLQQYNELKDIYLDPDYTDEDRLLAEVQVLFGVNPYQLTVSELKKYAQQLSFLGQKIPNMKLKKYYHLGGNKYELHKKVEELNVAQWIDWQNFLKSGGGDTDNYANLLSVFIFPAGEKEYNEDYDIQTVRNDISRYLTIPDAVSIATFFLTWQKALLINTLLYIRRMTLKTKLTRQQRKEVRRETRQVIKKIMIGD